MFHHMFLLQAHATPVDSSVVVGLLALFGVIITATASLFGISLKNAFDRRTDARLAAENARNALMARDAEQRLRLDTAIRAVQLFSSQSGVLAPPVQRAGALFTLCSLEQFDLTLALLDTLLANREIESPAAARIIDDILKRGNERQQTEATSLLLNHTDRFVSPAGYDLPDAILSGSVNAGEYLRSWIPDIITRLILVKRRQEWSERRGIVIPLVFGLVTHWQDKRNSNEQRQDTGILLKEFIEIFFPGLTMLYLGARRVDVGEIINEIQHTTAYFASTRDLLTRIARWRSEA